MMNDRILPLFAILVAIGVFFGYVRPAWSVTIAEIKTAIASDEQALAAAGAYNTRQNALAAARDNIDPANLERLTAFLPDSVDNVGLILDMNALAARSGLTLSNLDVTSNAPTKSEAPDVLPRPNGNPMSSIDLSLSATGTYSALQAFLVGVEKSLRLIEVQNISVRGSDTGVYAYQIKLRIFWLR